MLERENMPRPQAEFAKSSLTSDKALGLGKFREIRLRSRVFPIKMSVSFFPFVIHPCFEVRYIALIQENTLGTHSLSRTRIETFLGRPEVGLFM